MRWTTRPSSTPFAPLGLIGALLLLVSVVRLPEAWGATGAVAGAVLAGLFAASPGTSDGGHALFFVLLGMVYAGVAFVLARRGKQAQALTEAR